MTERKVILYSLSTCVYCKATQKMLDDLGVDYQCLKVDELSDSDKEKTIQELKKVNPRCSFPTVVIDDQVITGYRVQDIKEKLGIRTEVDALFDKLRKLNERKGYFFNNDKEKTFEILRSLLINKDRYGYMACPCRLAYGDRARDRDIICPCEYRAQDIQEYGSCFCGLYVSDEWNAGKIERLLEPERRPADLY